MAELYGSDAFSPGEIARRVELVGGSVLVALVYWVIYLRGGLLAAQRVKRIEEGGAPRGHHASEEADADRDQFGK